MWENPVTYLVALGAIGALIRAGMWIGAMNEHKGAATKFMTEIRDDLKTIRKDIKLIFRRIPVPDFGGSPRRLTDYGKNISDAVAAPAWAKEEAESLRSRVTDKQPFEIDEISRAYVGELELSPSIRQAAYEGGYLIEHVRTVLAIVLREELIRQTGVA